jgi:hypothetical protein
MVKGSDTHEFEGKIWFWSHTDIINSMLELNSEEPKKMTFEVVILNK